MKQKEGTIYMSITEVMSKEYDLSRWELIPNDESPRIPSWYWALRLHIEWKLDGFIPHIHFL